MRVPIYCNETFEALTIIKIQPWGLRMLEQGCVFLRFAPMPSASVRPVDYSEVIGDAIEVCTVRFDEIRLRGMGTWIGVTDDQETSLRLRSVFLPGQQSEVRELEQAAQARLMAEMLRGLSK
jgi:hypothetical protein